MTKDSSLPHSNNFTSNDGEDTIIQNIFDIIGTENKWCLEMGALDGLSNSNTWNLIQNQTWNTVLIEAEKRNIEKLKNLHQNNSRVTVIHAFASFEGMYTLDNMLKETPIPPNFDLLILDIDGNDFHVWESFQNYHPRVVGIEFNPTIPNEIDFVQPKDMRVQQGSSLRALVRLGKEKGYELVATTVANAFFVDATLFKKFAITDNSLDTLHTDTRYHTKLFQLYDGTLVLSGYKKLLWHKKVIKETDIQILSKRQRKYPARVEPSPTVRKVKDFVRKFWFYKTLLKIKQSLEYIFFHKRINKI